MGDPLIGGHQPLIMAGEKHQLKDPLLLRPAPCQVKVLADVDEANLSIIFKYVLNRILQIIDTVSVINIVMIISCNISHPSISSNLCRLMLIHGQEGLQLSLLIFFSGKLSRLSLLMLFMLSKKSGPRSCLSSTC